MYYFWLPDLFNNNLCVVKDFTDLKLIDFLFGQLSAE